MIKQTTKLIISPATNTLHSSSPGVGLFFAALGAVTGRSDYRELAIQAFRPTEIDFIERAAENQAWLAKEDIGGAFGLASTVYAATKTAVLTNSAQLLNLGCAVAGQLTFDHIQADQKLDVMFGSAGAILGLAPLYEITQDPLLLQKMIACGEQLLQNRVATASGLLAWPLNGQCLGGYSHGAAGNAYTLSRLYQFTQDGRFLAAAKEGIAYDNTLLDEAEGNWNYLLGGTARLRQPLVPRCTRHRASPFGHCGGNRHTQDLS
ncbi:MAG: lanthionine synthetase LanC family protein [Chloroflexota bacterium]